MAKCKVTMVKKSHAKTAGPVPKAAAGDPVAEFQFQDNQNDTVLVSGISGKGNKVDISDVATLAVTSSDEAIVTADVTGMVFTMHAVGPVGSANVVVVATWNDGSNGPFSITQPVKVVAGPAQDIVLELGTPFVN